MPRKQDHDIAELHLLGYLTGMTDVMDAPEVFLHGQHRILNHDLLSIFAIALVHGGNFQDNMAAGLLHLAMDDGQTLGKAALNEFFKFTADSVNGLIGVKQHAKKIKRQISYRSRPK